MVKLHTLGFLSASLRLIESVTSIRTDWFIHQQEPSTHSGHQILSGPGSNSYHS